MEGLDDLRRVLRELPHRVAETVLEDAARDAGEPILADATDRVSEDLGTLKQAMYLKVVTYLRSLTAVAIIGPRSRAAPHAHFVEFGTTERFTQAGASRGTMPPQPFLRPAMDTQRATALSRMRRTLGRGIERAAERLAGGRG
ncbi:MAG: HK97-gp10 family putative phage morphogenesis protein [Planctomycetota bacterium]